MKKQFLYAFLVLGILFLLYNYSFSIKTYLKCEPYNQDSKEILYFAFDKKTIWSNYDPINSKFRNASKATYGERYVTATWDNITINRESGTITITPSLTSIFVDFFKTEETKDLVLNCEKINKKKLPKEKVDKKFKKKKRATLWTSK